MKLKGLFSSDSQADAPVADHVLGLAHQQFLLHVERGHIDEARSYALEMLAHPSMGKSFLAYTGERAAQTGNRGIESRAFALLQEFAGQPASATHETVLTSSRAAMRRIDALPAMHTNDLGNTELMTGLVARMQQKTATLKPLDDELARARADLLKQVPATEHQQE